MTEMEEDARKTDPEHVGNQQVPAPAPQNATPSPALNAAEQPAKLSGDSIQSPFLGKLVPQKPATPLTSKALDPDEELRKTIAELTAIKERSSKKDATPKDTGETKMKAADLMHGGNVISLLQEEAQKESGIEPVTATRLTQADTPSERNIREVGLEPRRFPTGAPGRAPEDRPQEGLKNIRTYASDMSEEIRKRGETLATIVGAEKLKAQSPGDAETEKLNERKQRTQTLALLGGAGLLVLFGIGAIVAVLFLNQPRTTEQTRADIIPANRTVTLASDTGPTLSSLLSQARSDAQLNLGELEKIVLTANGVPLSPEATLIKLGAPAVLARNATDIFIGIHSFNRNQPFILVQVSAYDLSFQGMLTWEKTIGDSLGKFFAPGIGSAPALAFTDRVLQNVDLRESQAEWHIEYAFPERNLLVITTNDSTLREILTRLRLQSGN